MTKARSTERSSWGGFAALLLASTAVLMAGPALAQAQAPGAPAPDNAATPLAAQVNDVVVTATKRAQKLQNVPIAVTALTGQVITKMGGTDLSDVAGATPGLSLQSDRAGENQTYIRGISEVAGDVGKVGPAHLGDDLAGQRG